ncbi:MAG: hypothetical protein U9P10_16215 [Thermodesulfobacteriota bacterium]|nr:hypothetical protein [Thermodesulfobacteriota bacterium]
MRRYGVLGRNPWYCWVRVHGKQFHITFSPVITVPFVRAGDQMQGGNTTKALLFFIFYGTSI